MGAKRLVIVEKKTAFLITYQEYISQLHRISVFLHSYDYTYVLFYMFFSIVNIYHVKRQLEKFLSFYEFKR